MSIGNMSGAHVMARALKRHGVEVIFGQSMPSALFLVTPQFGIRQIGYRTENAGAIMADAYARVSHKVAVVTAQNGPAATLLVPGLAEAFKASIPIVAIVQDVARAFADKNAFQELDHLDLFRRREMGASRDRRQPHRRLCRHGVHRRRVRPPGPAVLMFQSTVLETARTADRPRASRRSARIRSTASARSGPRRGSGELLASAERPLVVAGGGVHLSDAADALAPFQERLAPGRHHRHGQGRGRRAASAVGRRGRLFHGRAEPPGTCAGWSTEADVILLVGNRTNQNGTDSWTLYPKGRDVHPSRRRRTGSRPQLRGAASGRRCEAWARRPFPRH